MVSFITIVEGIICNGKLRSSKDLLALARITTTTPQAPIQLNRLLGELLALVFSLIYANELLAQSLRGSS